MQRVGKIHCNGSFAIIQRQMFQDFQKFIAIPIFLLIVLLISYYCDEFLETLIAINF